MLAPVWDNTTLEDLNIVMTDASICGLGQAAPNPVRCVQKYFAHEIGGLSDAGPPQGAKTPLAGSAANVEPALSSSGSVANVGATP